MYLFQRVGSLLATRQYTSGPNYNRYLAEGLPLPDQAECPEWGIRAAYLLKADKGCHGAGYRILYVCIYR